MDMEANICAFALTTLFGMIFGYIVSRIEIYKSLSTACENHPYSMLFEWKEVFAKLHPFMKIKRALRKSKSPNAVNQ